MNPPIDKKKVVCVKHGWIVYKDECLNKFNGHKCNWYGMCWGWER